MWLLGRALEVRRVGGFCEGSSWGTSSVGATNVPGKEAD